MKTVRQGLTVVGVSALALVAYIVYSRYFK